jgi:Transposase and inactivated derivatives
VFYLEKLGEVCKKHDCHLHAYVLMTNHVHLLLTPHTEHGIGQVMQSLGRYYVQYFNYLYHRTGTLWEGRYKATLLDTTAYLLTCYRYIELNPVRAGIVNHPAAYPWSSYPYNALGKPDARITPPAQYWALGGSPEERQAAYRALFEADLDKKALSEIREVTNKAWVLGNKRFREEIQAQLNRRAAPKPKGGDRRSNEYREQRLINRVRPYRLLSVDPLSVSLYRSYQCGRVCGHCPIV